MPLPWPEIRDKAIAFSREWQDAESEQAESQSFWNDFFAVFGVPRRRVATFEEPDKKLGASWGSRPCLDVGRDRSTLLLNDKKA